MPQCYGNCKHYSLGFCKKYEKQILVSQNPFHRGIKFHPFDYMSLYYQKNQTDLTHLINIADKYLTTDIAKNIVVYYKKYNKLSYKQRKVLINQILYCYEDKPVPSVNEIWCQIEG